MIKILQGDCIEQMRTLPENSVDAVVTDPPYELGFMGKSWDNTSIAYNVNMWKEVLQVLKPGGHLLSFGGSRTYHRMACAIENVGFEIRDQIMWVYGSGFPKSLNIGKAIDKMQGNEREIIGNDKSGSKRNCMAGDFTGGQYALTKGNSAQEGFGTALKPAHEPIVLARKPLSEKTVAENVLKWGTGGLNIDGCRVGNNPGYKYNADKNGTTFHGQQGERIRQTAGKKGQQFIKSNQGRWPANFIHDGSQIVLGLFPNTKSTSGWTERVANKIYGGGKGTNIGKVFKPHSDSGSAARFFYCAKASKAERNAGCEEMEEKQTVGGGGGIGDYINDVNSASGKYGSEKAIAKNHHPTIKPIALMSYLCRLITPTNGVVLDPFMGSGSTGIACVREGFSFIGIEKDKEYCEIAKKRTQQAGLFCK